MNNYAISTSDLADSLTRSSAALVAANNSLEESIAMTAAANTTIQDPESVGNALKTVSMRIRGVKTELEEAGEETDGMVTNTAKLQEKIMALTNIDGSGGINILTNTGEFKSTYEILLAISKVWKDMDDMSQAALLELVAGKTRGSVVAALFQNGDVLENAYTSATEASGSAMGELETHLDSIQGRIDLFNNSLQTMWMNFLDSDVVKFFVDLASAAIKLADAIGVIPSAVGVFSGYKIIINDMKKAFGSTTVSAKQLRKEVHDYIQQQKDAATATTATANAKRAETAATNAAAGADAAEAGASAANAVANEQQANAAIKVKVHKKGEKASVDAAAASDAKETATSITNAGANEKQGAAGVAGGIANATGTAVSAATTVGQTAGIFAKVASAGSKVWTVVKTLGKSLGKIGLIIIAVEVATKLLGAAWDWLDKNVINKVEHIREAVEELQQTYEEAKKTFDDNLKTLTTSSDTKVYATLQDEFAELARGVDKYGNNISLTSDKYQRYKDICEQIVGINPDIAKGYDSATKAIGNNASALAQLIELQKIQQKQNVNDLLKDENLDNLASKAFANMDKHQKTLPYGNEKFNFGGVFHYALADAYNKKKRSEYSIFKEFTDKYELDFDWSDYGSSDVDHMNMGQDYMEAIIEDLKSSESILSQYFSQKYIDEMLEIGKKYYANIDQFNDKTNELRDGLIDTLLQVPYGEDAYDKLGDSSKNILVDWIKNSEIFKIDPNAFENEVQEQLDKNVDLIRNLVNDFADDNIQAIMDTVGNLDTSALTSREYLDEIRNAASGIWEAIGGEDNAYGFESAIDIQKLLGLDIDSETGKLDEIYNILAERLQLKRSDISSMFTHQTMSRDQMRAFLGIDWNAIGAEQLKGASDVWDLVNEQLKLNNIDSVQTYSELTSDIETYNDILAQTREIVSDNTEVTEEYKSALIELVGSEAEVNKYFDENNKLVVKNATGLQKLVAQAKKTKQATVAMAKAQAQLQYRELVQQMANSISANVLQASAYDFVKDAIKDNISVMEDQIEVLEQTIQQYSLLELSLSDAASAYNDYEKAKERDAEMAYDDSFLEMLKNIDEGLLNNETGTEAFEYAVKAVVPEEFWKDIDDVDEKIRAIHDYIDGDPVFSKLFHVDEESGELDINADNAREFVNMGLQKNNAGMSVFDGSSTDFTLTDNIKGIEDVAEFYGITEAAALAMFTALEKVDGKWGDILTQINMTPFERDVYATTKEMAELNEQFADGSIDVTTYAEKMAIANQQMAEYTQKAKDKLLGSDGGTEDTSDDTLGFIELDKQTAAKQEEVTKATERLVKAQEAYNKAKNEGASDDVLKRHQENIDKYTDKVTKVTEEWAKLVEQRGEYPSEQEISLVISDIDEELSKFGSEFDSKLSEYFKKNSDGYWVPIDTDLDLTDLETKEPDLIRYKNLLNSKTEIQAFADTTSAEKDANALKATVDGVISAIEANLITLDLDEDAVNNIVTQANKILDGITDHLGVKISASMPSWLKSILGWMGFDVSNDKQIDITSGDGGTVGVNGTANADGSWGAPKTETSLVGELGPEILVRDGHWTTVGNNGAEFTEVKKGDIIFNHKQSEQLLKNGYVTGRGKLYGGNSAFADGTAYEFGIPSYHPNTEDSTSFANGTAINTAWDDAISSLGDASDAADDFTDSIDWIEIRLEELDETISLLNAQLENATSAAEKNSKIDEIIAKNKEKMANLEAGADYYESYIDKFWKKIPAQYQEAAKNGAIAITDFAGEASEEVVEAIQKYREYVQKAADLKQQKEETKTENQGLAKQSIDNISSEYDNKASIYESSNEQLAAYNSLLETDKGSESAEIYKQMMENNKSIISLREEQRKNMQAELDKRVENGEIEKYSKDWYDSVNAIAAVDKEIIGLKTDTENYQDSINDIKWEHFDNEISRIQSVSEEADNLLDILSNKDMVTEDGEWTDEGITSLGLYAQKMEAAEAEALKYKDAIDDLNANWQEMGYTEQEYLDKLDDLKDGQYDAVKSYEDSKKAIVDLNKERVDAIKNGIDKEIDAYKELIDAKKEELDAEKD